MLLQLQEEDQLMAFQDENVRLDLAHHHRRMMNRQTSHLLATRHLVLPNLKPQAVPYNVYPGTCADATMALATSPLAKAQSPHLRILARP